MSQLREHEDLVDIVARAVPSERLDIDTLKDVNLYTRDGTVVPLSQVARVRYELEEPVLWRRNRDMAITVRADVKDGEQGVSVTQEIRPMLNDIEAKLPFGYRIDVGGAVEESDKANRSLLAVAPVMIVTILLILMLQLQSFSRMAMVFLTAPLGLIGVVAALLIFQAPLGFVAILGIIALCGMIMRNSVILIDQVQTGDGFWPRSLERRAGSGRAPDAAGGAHGRGYRARDDPAHAQHLLGPDGARDHGRPHRAGRSWPSSSARRSYAAWFGVRRVLDPGPAAVPAPAGWKTAMPRVIIFGATGSLGRHVLHQALAVGHGVTVVVRTPSKLPIEAGSSGRTGPRVDRARSRRAQAGGAGEHLGGRSRRHHLQRGARARHPPDVRK